MRAKDSASSAAPPTNAPSTSSWAIRPSTLSELTEPPYNILVWLAIFFLGIVFQPLLAQLPRPLEPIAARLQPTRRLVYKTVNDTNLHLHIFEPEGHSPTDRRPVFLAIHGGGWVNGNAQKFYPFADYFARLVSARSGWLRARRTVGPIADPLPVPFRQKSA